MRTYPFSVSPGLTRAKASFATLSPHPDRALVSSARIEGPAPTPSTRLPAKAQVGRAFAFLRLRSRTAVQQTHKNPPRLTDQGRDFVATLIVVPAAFATCVTALMILAELVKATSA